MADALDVDDPASDFSAPSGASGVSRLSLTQKLSTSTPGSHEAHGCTLFVNTCHPAVVPVRRATPKHPHSPTAAEGSPVLHHEKMLCPAREQMPGAARGRRQDGRQQHWSGMTKAWTKAVLRFHKALASSLELVDHAEQAQSIPWVRSCDPQHPS